MKKGVKPMQNTTNYGLKKPESTEFYNVDDMNANMDTIDTELKEHLDHTTNKNNPHGVTKNDVGLGNCDNTSDINKPISTATQAELDLKAKASDLTSHTSNVNNPHSVTKAQVGLGSVENKSSATIRGELTSSNVTTALGYTPLNPALKGAANGLAELDENGKVLTAQLPSYVDDVLEYASLSAFPTTGESGKIYIAKDTNRTYRWGGTAYAEISPSLALGETSSTAYRGDRGATAYTHSQTTSGNPHGVTKSDVGLGNVPNVATNDQTPTYTAATSNSNLTSGEKLSVAFGKIAKAISSLISHLSNKSNPHAVTKAQLSLDNVDNTSDADKPISTATQTELDTINNKLKWLELPTNAKVTFIKKGFKDDSEETSGATIRIGNSSMNNFVDDTYWFTVLWDGTFKVGLQQNNANKPTWYTK